MLPFLKLESQGNHFVLINFSDIISTEGGLTKEIVTPYALSRQICQPRFWVGADGLLVAQTVERRTVLRMFNPDGTEDFCGNGLLCLAYAHSKEKAANYELVIEHFGQEITAHVQIDGKTSIQVPPVSFRAVSIPLAEIDTELFMSPLSLGGKELIVSAVNVGSPHLVILVDEFPNETERSYLGLRLEYHRLFPQRTNITWVKPFDNHELEIRIWERGVGETLSCGTGSIAAASVFSRKNNCFGKFKVISLGGEVDVIVEDQGRDIFLQGYPHLVYRGSIPLHSLK